MRKILKIKFHSRVPEASRDCIVKQLKKWFDVCQCEDYDYYFAMETIYHDRDSMVELLESKQDAIRIMLCGEVVYPDLNLFDYAIYYFGHYKSFDRIIDSPYLYALEGSVYDSVGEIDNSKKDIDPEYILSTKSKFCNFIYSNPLAHPMRDEIFFALSKYKFIDSLGNHLKNVDIDDTRFSTGWEKISIKLKSPYKFSISVENAYAPGYTTEKIITSMLANSIPIYFGNPLIGEEFNEKAIINVHKYHDLSEVVDRVREIDENDQLYCEILAEPWRNAKQISTCVQRRVMYEEALKNLFEKDVQDARRRSRGTWGDVIYPNFMSNREDNILKKIIKRSIASWRKLV